MKRERAGHAPSKTPETPTTPTHPLWDKTNPSPPPRRSAMLHAMTHAASPWSHIRDLLAAILARVGTPFRLALTPLDRAARRELRRQIADLEDSVRQSLALIIARLVLVPHIAAACARRLARRAHGSGAGASFSFDLPEPRSSDKPPVFRYLVRARPDKKEAPAQPRPQSSARQPQRSQKRPRTMPADIPNLPLATRLAAVEHVIDDPEAAARDILRRHPQLALPQQGSPARTPQAEPRDTLPGATPSTPRPANTPHDPPGADTS